MSLSQLQTDVHVSKNKRNEFGGYNYRTAEGILAAAKAVLPEGATIVVDDQLQECAGQIFVSATATVTFSDGTSHKASGHAMHPLTKKGMDPSQITGAASSYARKYALSGLLALDDGSVDPDGAKEPFEPEPPKPETPKFDSAAARDRILAGIAKRKTKQALTEYWIAEKGTMDEISEPHFLEVKAAFKKAGEAAIDDPARQSAE